MTEGKKQEEWIPPDKSALFEISKVVANDLIQGETKHEIVTALVTGDGWPEAAASEFVDAVERDKEKYRSAVGSEASIRQDIYPPDWVGFGSMIGFFPGLGLFYALLSYRLGRSAGKGRQLWPPDPGSRRWSVIVLAGLLLWIPFLNMLVSYHYSRYVYRQGARLAASRPIN